MQITHEQARQLIQFRLDGELKYREHSLLASHLETCKQCQQYADSCVNVESVLRPLLHRNWDREPISLSIDRLTAKSNQKALDTLVVATRIAAVGAVFFAFFFSAWNFTISSRRTPTPFQQSVPVIPTPYLSTVTAGTQADPKGCTTTTYIVATNDTLAVIADRFGVSEEQILDASSLPNTTVIAGQALRIPICRTTASSPTASHTTTITPALFSTTTTPGG